MTTWIDQETGEIYEGSCPECERVKDDCALQVREQDRELAKIRVRVGKAERAVDREAIAKRDGATWATIREAWLRAFPDKKPTATGVKSARATQVFLRLAQGATVDDFLDAIEGAKHHPFVTFGKRTATATSKSKRADDLEDIASVKSDAMFDWLVMNGRAARVAETISAPF